MASKVDVHEIILAAGVPREGKSVLEKKSVMADVSDLTVVIDTTMQTTGSHDSKGACKEAPVHAFTNDRLYRRL